MTRGAWGSLFRFATICPEVVERHHNSAYYKAAPRTMPPQRWSFFVPVRRTLSSLGAVTGLGAFWVAELKRDPHAPFRSEDGTFILKLLLGHNTGFLSLSLTLSAGRIPPCGKEKIVSLVSSFPAVCRTQCTSRRP